MTQLSFVFFFHIFMQCECEEYRNPDPFLERSRDNLNLRNTVDHGLKYILFLSPENKRAHKLFWKITSHNLPDHLERAFMLIQHCLWQCLHLMLQRMPFCIFMFSIKMTCFTVMLISNIFSYISHPFRTC